MMKILKRPYLLIIAISVFFIACDKDNNSSNEEPTTTVELKSEANLFTWNALNLWYFWQADVSNLDDSKDDNKDSFYTFLNKYADPSELIENALRYYKSEEDRDRFTYYSDDYKTLTQAFQGISKSNGLEFGLARFSDNNDVYGYVRYIIPNSDASTKDISRGELFTHVNGTQITVSNYRELLFGNNDTYTLGMANITGTNYNVTEVPSSALNLNGKQVTLTKQELEEDPVFISKIILSGSSKIGYLMYNGFVSNFDEKLNDAFGYFKSNNVTDLVLDFRYNPGGSVNSSRLLSSMVYGTYTNKLYLRQRWNSKLQAQFSSEQLEDYFADKTNDNTPINTLNLSKVYVLTTKSSASASELVINALNPYIDVIKIGTTTTGKNEFSITLVDNPKNSYIYNPNTESNINPRNSWALQPLVGRNENAVGFYDYTNGFEPDYLLPEDISNLGVLGDENEPLLAKAIEIITGITAKSLQQYPSMPIQILDDSKANMPDAFRMRLDKPTIID